MIMSVYDTPRPEGALWILEDCWSPSDVAGWFSVDGSPPRPRRVINDFKVVSPNVEEIAVFAFDFVELGLNRDFGFYARCDLSMKQDAECRAHAIFIPNDDGEGVWFPFP